jgi:3-oxoacyl-ACP reductase-like protein
MSDTEQNTATEKPGRRNRKSGPRNEKPDQRQDAEAPIDAAATSADTAAPAGATSSAANSVAPAPPDTTLPMDPIPVSFQTIANAYGDYTRKSLEETRSFVEKLTGVRSLDKAMDVQSDFAIRTYDTFVAESQRIRALHRELARQTFRPLEELFARASPPGR